jgi:hypothetical protein
MSLDLPTTIMPFKKFKTIDEVANTYQLSFHKSNWMRELPQVQVPADLKRELHYMTQSYPYKVSEAAICESIIFPILREVWRNFDDTLMIWSHRAISFNKKLSGIPDYLIAKQSPLGKLVFGEPLLAVVEAKKDDFQLGWAQCALEMYTIQQINQKPELPVYGIVSNGDQWEFGQLENTQLTQNERFFTILQLEELFAAITYLFDQCQQTALRP